MNNNIINRIKELAHMYEHEAGMEKPKAFELATQVALAEAAQPKAEEPTPAKPRKGTGKKAQPKAEMTEAEKAEKAAKAEERAAKRLEYKQDKRSRNCLTKAENKQVAEWMRKNGRNPSDKADWEKAKSEWIAAHPLA